MRQVNVERVGFDMENKQALVLLKDEAGGRLLPIVVGALEVNAIHMAVEGLSAPRPLTHDLMKGLLDALEARLTQVLIDDLRDETFYAQITLDARGETREIDARPSDAIALALRFKAPIYVSDVVMELAGIPVGDGGPEGNVH